jgi:hypothetical protein
MNHTGEELHPQMRIRCTIVGADSRARDDAGTWNGWIGIQDFQEPRMTTRGWMIAVAIVGLLMGGLVGVCRLAKQRELMLLHYRHHMRMLDWCRVQEGAVCDSSRIYDGITEILEGKAGLDRQLGLMSSRPLIDADRPALARLRRITAHHAALARKYEHAARYPWLSVEPDPPEPNRNRSGACGEP